MLNPLGTELKRSKYRLLGLVGQGQFGRVFCAVHRQTGHLVALKDLESRRFPTHKFLRELRFLLSLQHVNIVTCYALEHTRTGRYLVMDYCEGGTLRSLIEEGRLNLCQSLKLVLNILAGLEHAHQRGIVHCDVKPENILLTIQPTGWIARISDFGIARLVQEATVYEGVGNTGSPAYMAPERFYGQYSCRSDLYSVGILLFELLAGYRPFTGTPIELMTAHLNRPVKLPDCIDEVWHPILITALQKLPARRYRSATEMLAALQQASVAAGCDRPNLPSNSVPLFQTVAFPSTPHLALPQATLSERVSFLTVATADWGIRLNGNHQADGQRLYEVQGKQLRIHHYQPNDSWEQVQQVLTFSAPIQELLLHRRGCLAITTNSVCNFLWQDASHLKLETRFVINLEQKAGFAVDPLGRWLAIATPDHLGVTSLRFLRLTKSPISLASKPASLDRNLSDQSLLCLIALDSRHIAVVSRSDSGELARQPERCPLRQTLFEIVTRRGDRLGTLLTNLQIGQVYTTPIPYRLIATDAYNAQTLTLIDLKPFRVTRFATVNIVPSWMVMTEWGYVLMDQQGQIVLIDTYGQTVGHIDGPAHPTAIAALDARTLLIATWDGQQGHLYPLDLLKAGVELVL